MVPIFGQKTSIFTASQHLFVFVAKCKIPKNEHYDDIFQNYKHEYVFVYY